jgi:hypothetical protein
MLCSQVVGRIPCSFEQRASSHQSSCVVIMPGNNDVVTVIAPHSDRILDILPLILEQRLGSFWEILDVE